MLTGTGLLGSGPVYAMGSFLCVCHGLVLEF